MKSRLKSRMKSKMNSMMPKLLSALSLTIAGCGGSGGNAALSKSFSYGPAAAPSASEQSAANSAQSSLTDTASFSSSPDAARGAAVVVFADALAAVALGSASGPLPHPQSGEIQRAIRAAADFSACATLSGGTVTFKNCSQSEGGYTVTLDGTISSSGGAVSWNMTGGFSGTQNNTTAKIDLHQAGAMTVTASTLNGHATSDFGGNVSGQGQNVSFGFASAVLVDLTWQSAPSSCVTGGSVEVRRVWTQKPSGASGPAFNDAAVKLTWTGCNAVQIAHSK